MYSTVLSVRTVRGAASSSCQAAAQLNGTRCAELLDVYRAAVLAAQQCLRRFPAPSLSSLHCFLAEFQACMHTPVPAYIICMLPTNCPSRPLILH